MNNRQDKSISVGKRVRVNGFEYLGHGEVIRLRDSGNISQADIIFEREDEKRVESFPVGKLIPVPDIFERLQEKDFDAPLDFFLKQLAYQLPLCNAGGELSNARTDLLPHQILLTMDVVEAERRRFLIADEVGLGKTIETGLIIRELFARGEAGRFLVVCPAGLTKNWRSELRDAFRINFDILGIDFKGSDSLIWENHDRVIASIDTIKKPKRIEQLKNAPKWDLIIVDEAHHLSRRRYGKKIDVTENYRLADVLRGLTKDFLFLSATPHQGDSFQFWSLIQLLDDQLFSSPEEMSDHRGLLSRVMFRRTKREVTDMEGSPIFMRRQVHTQAFPLATKERWFYDKLTEYLRVGYGVAGIDKRKTTSRQRAVGFVMTTFQKMMSSSPRAIRQALRRRLLVLLARKHMALESKALKSSTPGIPEKLLKIQEEMRDLVIQIESIKESPEQKAAADTYIAKVKQRIARKGRKDEELTSWALDAEDEPENGIYADVEIPNEIKMVRELIKLAPSGTDRKFDTLIRAVEQVRRISPQDKMVIFTQYRETLEFLYEELGKLYGHNKVARLKGGPLDEKIAAVEAFWEEDGAQFLVSTSAGGEGINLQVCHILFNYDLPWNPMAVEQRIGRIHRYGQKDTVQVYNLVAEDTVEERIYSLLEQKLFEIAKTIGKVDATTGEVVEDFRSEILGFLGSSPNYQELYKKALIDKDYERTERELAEAIEKARQASEALRKLSQEMEPFNYDRYKKLKGPYSLDDLRLFVERAVIRLGGLFIPRGDEVYIESPKELLKLPRIASRYEHAVFDRKLAMRKRKAELFGLGHPFVDGLISHLKSSSFSGELAFAGRLSNNQEESLSVRCYFEVTLEASAKKSFYKEFELLPDGSVREVEDFKDIAAMNNLQNRRLESYDARPSIKYDMLGDIKERVSSIIRSEEARFRASFDGVLAVNSRIVGTCIS